MSRLNTAQRVEILKWLVEGASLRAISRNTGASINTVTKLLVAACTACTACAAYHDESRTPLGDASSARGDQCGYARR